MVNVGLVTALRTPSARQAPRTNVVFPAPSSPATRTTSPGFSDTASFAASASVSAGPVVSETLRPSGPPIGQPAQREAGAEQQQAGGDDQAHVQAGAWELLADRGRGGLRLGGGGRRSGRGCGRRSLRRRCRRLLLRLRLSLPAAARERVLVLLVPGAALGVRCRRRCRGEAQRRCCCGDAVLA